MTECEIEALLREASDAGVYFVTDGRDSLRYRARKEPAAALLARLQAAPKADMIAVLRRRPRCCECGHRIIEPAVAWLGGEPVHRGCGERAWRAAWQAKAPGVPEVAV